MTCLTTGVERFNLCVTKKAATVATTSSANTAIATVAVCGRSAVRIAYQRQRRVGYGEVGEALRPPCREGPPDRPAVTDDERRQRAPRHVGEPGLDARRVFLQRLAPGEAEVGLYREGARPGVRVLGLDVGDQAALPLAAP